MFDNNDTNKRNSDADLYYKLGDALKYTLLYELKENCRHEHFKNYYSVVAYMYLYQLISRDTAEYLIKLYYSMKNEVYTHEKLCQLVALNIMDDRVFKNYANNRTFSDVLETLNEYQIDEWVVSSRFELFQLIPKVRLAKNKLFFFMDKGLDAKLYMTYTRDIVEKHTLIDVSDLISNRFIDFLDDDHSYKNNYVYLEYKHSGYNYCKYDYDTNTEECFSGKLLGFALDKPVTVNFYQGELWLTYNCDSEKIGLIKFDEDMKYVVKPQYMLVESAYLATSFDRPYRYFYSGEITHCSYQEAAEALWHMLCPMLLCQIAPERMSVRKMDFLRRELYKRVPEKFTIRVMKSIISKTYVDIEEKPHIKLFSIMLNMIERYIDKDDDILELLYSLIDVSIQDGFEYLMDRFPSIELYKGMEGLNSEGKLKELLKDPAKLNMTLYSRLGLSKEKCSMEDDKDAVLGTFEIDDMEYNYDFVSFDECILVGGALIPKERRYKGLVTLDTNTGMYNLHYDTYLNEEKKNLIVTSFGLACKEYTWIYNK